LLAYNGHLDTYPVNEALPWTVPPLSGLLRDGQLYGRGVADMKGGIAASMLAFALLAEYRDTWRGEALLTLAGDEESMGPLGTKWLLDNVPGLAQASWRGSGGCGLECLMAGPLSTSGYGAPPLLPAYALQLPAVEHLHRQILHRTVHLHRLKQPVRTVVKQLA
jgi:hypothetical protein